MRPPALRRCALLAMLLACADAALAQQLVDNGPLRTGQNDGANGADTSAVQAGDGQTVTGYAAGGATRVADDIVVPASGWLLSGLRLAAFRNGATPADLRIGDARVRIWDGVPEEPGSTMVFDSSVDGGTSSAVTWSGMYRVVGARTGEARRPVAHVQVALPPVVLRGGTYWLDWSVAGIGDAVPYVPPVTRTGQAGSGNALQRRGGMWQSIDGTGAGEELPYVLFGTTLPPEIFADSFE